MSGLIKGAGAAFVVLVLLLALAYGGASDSVDTAADQRGSSSYAFTQALESLIASAGEDRSASFRLGLALALMAVAGALQFQLSFAWTGNRIVSLISGAIFVLHPFQASTLRSPDVLVHVLPAVFVLATLVLRERSWERQRLGLSTVSFELAALTALAFGAFSGPSALALPLLLLLVEVLFHRREPPGRDREVLSWVVLYGLVASLCWHFARPDSFGYVGVARGFAEAFPRLFFMNLVGQEARWVAALFVLLGIACAVMGIVSLRRSPRWIIVYGALAILWYALALVPTALGIVPESGSERLLGFAGAGLLLPALGWRLLLGFIPPKPPEAPPSVVARSDAVDSSLPPWPKLPQSTPPQAPGFPKTLLPEVRDAVETAVSAAVEASVHGVLKSLGADPLVTANRLAPGTNYAREWNAYEAAWKADGAREGRRLLGEEWTDQTLDRALFENYCQPYLWPSATVLEVGQGGGKFTALMSPLVKRVVCVDVSRNMLRRAQKDLAAQSNVSLVLSDGRGLQCLAPGSIDFAFSYDVFVHLDQEDIYLYFEDLARVLRPSGRAAISFANLLDPEGFRQFKTAAASHRTGRRSEGRINFLSPEIIRTLALSARLSVESIHLAANNRDFVAILERPVLCR